MTNTMTIKQPIRARHGDRWMRKCLYALAGLFFLLCAQASQAAPACTYAAQGFITLYDPASSTTRTNAGASMLSIHCTGGMASGYNFYTFCTSSDAATAAGTAGTTVSPYRLAKSAQGNSIQYQITNTTGTIPWTSANIVIANWNAFNTPILSNTSLASSMAITIPALQSASAGDYMTTVPLTISPRINYGSTAPGCSGGAAVPGSIVNIPITVRVGSACAISFVQDMDLGQITVTSGAVDATYGFGAIHLSCSSGLAYTLNFSDGNQPLGSTVDRRRMVNGTSYFSYGLYKTSALTTEYKNVPGTGTGVRQQVLVYASVPSQIPTSLTNGIYRDTVIFMVNY